jgi:hypothetical protein
MPNHTANNFTVTGSLVDIHRFIKAVKTEESNLDFNGVVPMPVDLKGTTSPVRIQTQQDIDNICFDWNKKKEATNPDECVVEGRKALGTRQSRERRMMNFLPSMGSTTGMTGLLPTGLHQVERL